MTTRREVLKGAVVLAATGKLTDGGFAPVTPPGRPTRDFDVLPPGAGSRAAFSRKCAACQLCVANCPGKCLKPSTRLRNFGQPVMDFREGYCIVNCVKCGEVCPEGALRFLQREQRPNVHMGQAVWRKDLCVRMTTGDACTACERKCPVRAIHLVRGVPIVDRQKCIGCGACEHVCPARPEPAIVVQGFEVQRIVNPITEADLLAEMKARIDAGAAVVVAKDGVIIAEEEGHGVEPVLRLLDADRLRGAIVFDRVVGRAAASVFVVGGAKKAFTLLADEGSAAFCREHGLALTAEKTVDRILNRDRTGACPLEQAVDGIDDPRKMVDAIRTAGRFQ